MLLVEKLWLAKLNSVAQCGAITKLNEAQYTIAEAFIPKTKTREELIAYIKSKPWSPVIYENPHNWSEDKIKLEIHKIGLLPISKIIIKL
jgi:hypothetical protein